MNQPRQENPIKVFCTVDRFCMVESDDGVFCTKCQKPLVDLNRNQTSAPHDEGTCGFYRVMGVTALASTLALVACKSNPRRDIQVGEMTLPPGQQENVRVGKMQMPQAGYPVAAFVPGRDDRVISPYDGKEVDVSGLPEGALVMDPHFPAEEKKFFRVPASKDGATQPKE